VLVTEVGIPTPGPGRLPATGTSGTSPMLTIAMLLMLAGGVVLGGRRRPSH
jgi:LPXTG-motif cell wall-anchored protein